MRFRRYVCSVIPFSVKDSSAETTNVVMLCRDNIRSYDITTRTGSRSMALLLEEPDKEQVSWYTNGFSAGGYARLNW